jgi:hypothetical protein
LVAGEGGGINSLEENVKKEVDDLKLMARNWVTGFRRWVEEDGDPKFAQMEFLEEMEMYLVPYLARLVELKHLTQQEAGEVATYFLEQCSALGDRTS